MRAAFVGTLPGLALGLTTGALLSSRAPTYGRGAMIQSAALGGAFTGALMQLALQWNPYGTGWAYSVGHPPATLDPSIRYKQRACSNMPPNADASCAFPDSSVLDLMPGALIGLNVGIAAGLLGAYLPDQKRYGPSWQRVLLIDLAAGAGALAGGVAGCVNNATACLVNSNPTSEAHAQSATAALIGGGIGLLGGVLLTRHLDDDRAQTPPKISLSTTLMPVRTADGNVATGIGAVGSF
jgi:hypothetical protein